MKQVYTLYLVLLLCLPATLIHAQQMNRVRQTIDTLCSPAMHGRGYIFDGDKKAADLISYTFRSAGLKSFGSSYFQPFSLTVNRITATPQLQADKIKLTAGEDFVAGAASASGKGKAKVLALDTLVFTDTTVASKFFSQPLKKKAILYRQQDKQKLIKLPEPYQKQLQAAKLQIILQPKELLTPVARQQTLPVLEVKTTAWPTQTRKVKYNIQADMAQNYKTQNVVAFVEGSIKPDSFIVFSAHYDHLGGQGKDVYFPGANDNASGTAMLLELAHHYSQPENKPKYSMAFIAFAAEEAGLLGSYHFVQNPLFPLGQIRFLVNLDLLGTGDDGMMVVNGSIHPKEFNLLTQLNQQQHYLTQIRSRGRAANSDHFPFSEKGVPAFFFYTLGGTTAYHNTNDKAEQLPLTRFPEVFKLITAFTAQLQ
ncbi:M28 family metallopeptidase [Pontibacter vulgaris]|uniref:M28 family metallopeptidase n=1 Tax=Pontibacter vulgaris TaxID=2905679 RepID=UPI001FA7743B|nr:M28 family peptidase [Pontibacter vulgaris]